MKNYSQSRLYDAPGNDEELADVLTAISVVSKRLARKLTAASCQRNHKAEYECPYRQRGGTDEALRDQCGNHASGRRHPLR